MSKSEIIFIISFLLLSVAGMFFAAMEKIAHHYKKSPFYTFKNQKFWKYPESENNKYKYRLKKGYKYKVLNFLLTHVLVSFTSGWHLMKFFATNIIFIVITLFATFPFELILKRYNFHFYWWHYFIIFVLVKIFFGYPFTIFYNKILSKK